MQSSCGTLLLILNPYSAEICLCNRQRFVCSFRFIRIPMLWVYGYFLHFLFFQCEDRLRRSPRQSISSKTNLPQPTRPIYMPTRPKQLAQHLYQIAPHLDQLARHIYKFVPHKSNQFGDVNIICHVYEFNVSQISVIKSS